MKNIKDFKFTRRIFILYIIKIILAVTLFVRLFYLQIIKFYTLVTLNY